MYISTVGGGYNNTAGEDYSTVAGGLGNTASGAVSAVGGGSNNAASGDASTVAGGVLNTASGDHSFAAGRRAKAVHDGAFVWADSTDADFSSTDHNQFLIRASGGVGIGTSSPSEQLDVAGHVLVKGLDGFDANGEVANLYLGDGENYVRATYAGGMSIGTFGGLATKFFVGGVEIFNVSGGGVCWYGSSGSCSDRRFKKDITSITHALDQVSRLHGITHTWRVDEFPTKGFAEGEQFGFIAQDVQEILPSLVSNDGDGYLYVDYAKVTPLLVEAVKELSVENDDLKAQIAQLTSLVETVLANQQEANSHGSDELASK